MDTQGTLHPGGQRSQGKAEPLTLSPRSPFSPCKGKKTKSGQFWAVPMPSLNRRGTCWVEPIISGIRVCACHVPLPTLPSASSSSGTCLCVQAQLVGGTAHEQGQQESAGEQLQAAGCSPIHLPTHPPSNPHAAPGRCTFTNSPGGPGSPMGPSGPGGPGSPRGPRGPGIPGEPGLP